MSLDVAARRSDLRSFLIASRARIDPRDVGLPEYGRRHVSGLRRQEVAELVGVSGRWYELFESGSSDRRFSAEFVHRVAGALRLDQRECATLFRLALPEVAAAAEVFERNARAEIVALADPPPAMSSLIAPVTSLSDVEEVRRFLIMQREHFLTSRWSEEERLPREPSIILRPRILNSWNRSRKLRVNVGRTEAPLLVGDETVVTSPSPAQERLLRASSTVLTHLANTLAEIGYAIVLADGTGTILDIRCDRGMRRKLERIAFEPRSNWSEAGTGTNAIGTALSDNRPLQLMAAEHYCDGWQDLTCTAAPIHDPETGDITGVLDITGDYRLVRPELLGTIVRYAIEIEERLAAPDLHSTSM